MISSGTVAGCLLCAAWGIAVPLDSGLFSGTPVVHFSFEPEEDLDYDGLPDDWIRRKGPQFPRYVRIGIDCACGSHGEQSLRIDANGGPAILYSPLNVPHARIDALHTYRFRGKIRTKGLTHDAAVISVSFLNHRRQRIQRFLTSMVSGTHDDWQTVELPHIVPHADARFVVIGCHLVPGEEPGIGGTAWFDDLVLTRSPRLDIASNFFTHFLSEDHDVQVVAGVSGLDDGHRYELRFQFFDADDRLLEERLDPLTTDVASAESAPPRTAQAIAWTLGQRPPPGYYRIAATLLCDGVPMQYEETSLAVMRLVDRPRVRGEFGWTIDGRPAQLQPEALVNIAAQSGINWIKFPIWSSVRADDREYAAELAEFFDRLDDHNIATIGLFSDPPQPLRNKFARNWLGVSEIFSSPSSLWAPYVEPVVARFSSTIRHWQLGDEDDSSFEGLSDLAGALARAHAEINRIGLNAEVGIPWRRDRSLPDLPPGTLTFISLRETEMLDIDAQRAALSTTGQTRRARWVVLQPQLLAGDRKERANQLVRKMIAAKMAGVDAIFVNRVFDGRNGLLYPDGAPTDLFLPWRTTALALQNTEYLGELDLPQGSRNAVFARSDDDEAVIVVWSDNPSDLPEELYLGENVVETDLWGRTTPLPLNDAKEQRISVQTTPKILRGCSKAVARWRLATQFEVGKIRSEYGSHADAILGRNTFPLGVSGKALLETPSRHLRRSDDSMYRDAGSGWEAEPREWTFTAAAGESFRLPVFLTLPSDVNLGETRMTITFMITADRPYRFQVRSKYHVGSGDVKLWVVDRKLPDGRLEIEQKVVNSTDPLEVLEFRCSLLIPGSRRQKVRIARLGAGEDRKFYYLPDAEAFRGKELRIKLEQEGGGRILNHNWTVGASWPPNEVESLELAAPQ